MGLLRKKVVDPEYRIRHEGQRPCAINDRFRAPRKGTPTPGRPTNAGSQPARRHFFGRPPPSGRGRTPRLKPSPTEKSPEAGRSPGSTWPYTPPTVEIARQAALHAASPWFWGLMAAVASLAVLLSVFMSWRAARGRGIPAVRRPSAGRIDTPPQGSSCGCSCCSGGELPCHWKDIPWQRVNPPRRAGRQGGSCPALKSAGGA